jgi:hypothetical protein
VVCFRSEASPIRARILNLDPVAILAPNRLLHSQMNDPSDSARIRRERTTVRAMVEMYCRHHHGGSHLCDSCAELADYAGRKLDRCPYGSDKPACTHCPIHCYGAEPRERMREVMRFAGPRMLLRHPYLAVRHLIDERRKAPELPKKSKTADD